MGLLLDHALSCLSIQAKESFCIQSKARSHWVWLGGVTSAAGCSYLGRKEGDLHCESPSKPARALAFIGLEGKNTLLSAVLPGRLQDGSQGMQLHVRAGDLQDASVHSETFAETAA